MNDKKRTISERMRAQDYTTVKELPACKENISPPKANLPYPSTYKQIDELEVIAKDIEKALEQDDRAVIVEKPKSIPPSKK